MFRKKDIIVERESLENVNFTDKKNPVEGIASMAIGIASIVVFLALCVTSTVMEGNGRLWIGLVGCVMAICNLWGLFLAMKALNKEYAYRKMATVGVVLNAVISIGYVAIYVWGALI